MLVEPRRGNQRSASITLLIVFLLGIGIGFSLAYAVFDIARISFDAEGELARTDEARPPIPEDEPADVPLSAPMAEPSFPDYAEAADVGELWPAMHLMVRLSLDTPELSGELQHMLASFKPGAVLLEGPVLEDVLKTQQAVGAIKEAVDLGTNLDDLPLIAAAQEGRGANPFSLPEPAAAAELAALNHPVATEEAAYAAANAARDRGIGVLLAPVLDVYVPDLAAPAWADRTFGSEPATVVAVGLDYAHALLNAGVIPVVKHYPGLAAADGAKSMPAITERDVNVLAERMFLPFARAAQEEMPGMLVGNVAVPALTPANPNLPATLAPQLVEGLLRMQWGYEGLVLADDVAQLSKVGIRAPVAAVEALRAGCDMVIIGTADAETLEQVCLAIQEAVEEGRLRSEALERSKIRLAEWQMRLGVAPRPPVMLDLLAESQHAQVEPAPEAAPERAGQVEGPERHVVQPGETLTAIAERYGVALQDLRRWNNIRGDILLAGSSLRLRNPDKADAAPMPPAPEEAAELPVPDLTAPAAQPEAAPIPEAEDAPAAPDDVADGGTPAEPEAETLAPAEEAPMGPPIEAMGQPRDSEEAAEEEAKAPEAEAGAQEAVDDAAPVEQAQETAAEETPEAPADDAEAEPEAAPDAPADDAEAEPVTAPDAPADDAEAAPEAAAPEEAPAVPEFHTIKVGDTLRKIAERFNTTVPELVRLNDLRDADHIELGQRLRVRPADGR